MSGAGGMGGTDTGGTGTGGFGGMGGTDTGGTGHAGSISATFPTASGAAGAARGALTAVLTVCRGAFTLDAVMDAAPGEVLAVLGPNGAGKSTLLAVLAGLLAPDTGTVTLGGRTLTGFGVLVPPERRRVGLMGQDPLLFPHLTAAENVAFGPRSRGVRRRAAMAPARKWLERLELSEFAGRRPQDLSGGQRQRVALARALAAGPELLLLDEPLGALDVGTAPEIRQVLRTHLRGSGTTTILVTHDVLDAAVLADRVLVLVDGRVVDSGPTAAVLAAPRSPFSAALAGLNLLTGTVRAAAGADRIATMAATDGRQVSGVAAEDLPSGAPAAAVFAPSAVAVYSANDAPAGGSPRNRWPAQVATLEPGTASIRLRTAGEPAIAVDLTAAAVAELGLTSGSQIQLSVKATEVRIHRR